MFPQDTPQNVEVVPVRLRQAASTLVRFFQEHSSLRSSQTVRSMLPLLHSLEQGRWFPRGYVQGLIEFLAQLNQQALVASQPLTKVAIEECLFLLSGSSEFPTAPLEEAVNQASPEPLPDDFDTELVDQPQPAAPQQRYSPIDKAPSQRRPSVALKRAEAGEPIHQNYQVLEKIGEGGMGTVYRGTHRPTGRTVALKVLNHFKDPNHIQALLDEAKTGKRVDHEHCVEIYEVVFDQQRESPVIVSEFVDGFNAQDWLQLPWMQAPDASSGKSRALPMHAALLLLEQMHRGLWAAHSQGIVHQDIKPENFIVTRRVIDLLRAEYESEGQLTDEQITRVFLTQRRRAWVKLSDWGLALARDDNDPHMSRSLTFTHVPEAKRGGTLVYMPPEQIDGVGISRKTDIFALGLVFYQLLTGQTPMMARRYAEGLNEANYESVDLFLITMASSRSPSAISLRRDQNLKPHRRYWSLLKLMRQMCMRHRNKRVGSDELLTELANTLDDWDEEQWQNPTLRVPLILAAVTVGLVLVLALAWLPDSKKTSTGDGKPAKNELLLSVEERRRQANNKTLLAVLDGQVQAITQFTELPKGSARSLISLKAPSLDFEKLEQLDLQEAEALKAWTGRVGFPGLTTVNDELAESFAGFQAQALELNGLKSLTLTQAQSLVRYRGRLSLNGLAEPTEAVFMALGDFKGGLSLNAVEDIDAAQLKELLAGVHSLSLDGLQTITEQQAQLLGSKALKALTLNGLQELSPELGAKLAKCPGRLDLNGLTNLTPQLVKSLSGHRGELHLNGVKALTQEAADGFEKKRGALSLRGLESLPEDLITSLSKRDHPTFFHKSQQLRFESMKTKLRQWRTAEDIRAGRHKAHRKLSSLTEELARLLVSGPLDELHFENLTTIDKRALKALAGSAKTMHFPKLTQCSDAQAKQFGRFQARQLYLDGLTDGPPMRLNLLARSVGALSLDGLTTLSDAQFEALASHSGGISLDGIQDWTPLRLRRLAQNNRVVSLGAWSKPNSVGIEALCSGQVQTLKLDGVTQLPVDLARKLSRFEGTLTLDGLTTLTAPSAKYLSLCPGNLSFKSLGAISHGAAEALAKHKQRISFGALKRLDNRLAYALSKYRGHELRFGKIAECTDEAVFILAHYRGRITARRKLVDALKACDKEAGGNRVMWDFFRSKGVDGAAMFLKDLSHMDRDTATLLADSSNKELAFGRLRVLMPEAAAELSRFRGPVHFQALPKLSLAVAQSLAKIDGPLYFHAVTKLPPEVAKAFSVHKGGWLFFGELEALELSSAQALAKRPGRLCLDGLSIMPVSLAEILSTHDGNLQLRGIRELDQLKATHLAKHKGPLILGLRRCPPKVARALAKHQGLLILDELKKLSDASAAELAQHVGGLHFASLQGISDQALRQLATAKGEFHAGSALIQRARALLKRN